MHSLTCKIAAFLFPSSFMHELMIIFYSTRLFSKRKFENEKKCKMKLSLNKKQEIFLFARPVPRQNAILFCAYLGLQNVLLFLGPEPKIWWDNF
jgi:hypothetical protein